jgi:branched-chain amino acid aminotransferase
VSITTHALNYGTGVFEGMVAAWDGATAQFLMFRMPDHYQRMHRSCSILGIMLDRSPEELTELTGQLLAMNSHRANVYIRAVAYKSYEGIGVRLHDLVDDFYAFSIPLTMTFQSEAIACCIATWRRFDDNVVPPRAKVTGMYVNNALARTEAVKNGFDEAIMLNQAGYVCEACGENIFLVEGNRLVTPGLDEGILPGITRDAIIQLAREELGIVTLERRMSRGELYAADECFLTGSLSGVKPVKSVDRRPIGVGAAGPITLRLQELYLKAMYGHLPKYRHWLTPVVV